MSDNEPSPPDADDSAAALISDDARETEADRQKREERHLRQRNALIALTARASQFSSDVTSVLQHITEVAAITLGVSRVSIWRYTSRRAGLHCVDLYEVEEDRHSEGQELAESSYPAYFHAIAETDVLAADDAMKDSRTQEFTHSYLLPLGITSMMDAPIHVGWMVDGVLCHEQVGPARKWTADEKTFAVAVANLVSLALEVWERKQAEDQLRVFRRFSDSAGQGFAMATLDGRITYINPAMSRLLGEKNPGNAVGTSLFNYFPSDQQMLVEEEIMPRVMRDGSWTGERTLRSSQGRMTTVLENLFLIRDEAGQPASLAEVITDLSDRKSGAD